MSCILIDSHLSDGDQLAMHDVFPLRGIDLFNTFMAKAHYCATGAMHIFILYHLHFWS